MNPKIYSVQLTESVIKTSIVQEQLNNIHQDVEYDYLAGHLSYAQYIDLRGKIIVATCELALK